MWKEISTRFLKIRKTPIPIVKEVIYLVVTINSRLPRVPPMTKALCRATGVFETLCPSIKYNIPTPQEFKLLCCIQLTRLLLIIWSDTSPFQMERFRRHRHRTNARALSRRRPNHRRASNEILEFIPTNRRR